MLAFTLIWKTIQKFYDATHCYDCFVAEEFSLLEVYSTPLSKDSSALKTIIVMKGAVFDLNNSVLLRHDCSSFEASSRVSGEILATKFCQPSSLMKVVEQILEAQVYLRGELCVYNLQCTALFHINRSVCSSGEYNTRQNESRVTPNCKVTPRTINDALCLGTIRVRIALNDHFISPSSTHPSGYSSGDGHRSPLISNGQRTASR